MAIHSTLDLMYQFFVFAEMLYGYILRDYTDAGCVVSRVTTMVFPHVQTNNQVEKFGLLPTTCEQ